MSLADQVVVITGAGSGLGRALALGFAGDGAHVIAFGRRREPLEETARAAAPAGSLQVVVGDVSESADVARLVQVAHESRGRVDVLVNNAAVYPKIGFLESSLEDWAKALDINVVGVARCCHAVLPGMLERRHGRIINLGSLAWKQPIPDSSVYSASKGAVRAFTRALAAEIDRARYPDVIINELLPGIYRTSMSEEGDDPEQVYPHARRLATLPAGGPHGESFLKSEIYDEYPGLKSRLKGKLARLLGRR